jgi:hypothetical protein
MTDLNSFPRDVVDGRRKIAQLVGKSDLVENDKITLEVPASSRMISSSRMDTQTVTINVPWQKQLGNSREGSDTIT